MGNAAVGCSSVVAQGPCASYASCHAPKSLSPCEAGADDCGSIVVARSTGSSILPTALPSARVSPISPSSPRSPMSRSGSKKAGPPPSFRSVAQGGTEDFSVWSPWASSASAWAPGGVGGVADYESEGDELVRCTSRKNTRTYTGPLSPLDIREEDDLQYRLLCAARTGHFKDVVDAIADGASVNTPSKSAQTALHLASAQGGKASVEIIRFLLQILADIEQTDNSGKTALHFACRCGNFAAARELLVHKANVSSKTTTGVTPLMEAAQDGHPGIGNLLVYYKANLSAKDASGWQAAHHAADYQRHQFVQWAISNQAIAAVAFDGTTPLMVAASHGDIGTAKVLFKGRADVDLVDRAGDTALIRAIKARKPHFADFLLWRADADYKVFNRQGLQAYDVAESLGLHYVARRIIAKEHRDAVCDDEARVAAEREEAKKAVGKKSH